MCYPFLPAARLRTVTVDTVLTVDSSWSGSRVMTVAFSAADYPDEQSRAALDGMMARCPSAMTYGKQEKDSQIQYIFTLEFTSHEDYQKKLEALMGSAPYGAFSHTDSIFFKGTRIYEDFDSAALFAWMLEEPEEKPGFSLQCGKNVSGPGWQSLAHARPDHREPGGGASARG